MTTNEAETSTKDAAGSAADRRDVKDEAARKKRRPAGLVVAVIVVAALVIGGSVLIYHKVVHAFSPPAEAGADDKPYIAPPSKPATSVIKPDVPVKQQIVQKDYKEKIREMLDSGQSVHEISKKTGIRADEIRKIKKEKSQDPGTK